MILRRERISDQLSRCLVIMECIYRLERPTGESIYLAVRASSPRKVCDRTIWRDLNTLIEIGFITREDTARSTGGKSFHYRIAEPKTIIKECSKINSATKL